MRTSTIEAAAEWLIIALALLLVALPFLLIKLLCSLGDIDRD